MSWNIGIHKNTLRIGEETVDKFEALFNKNGEEDLYFTPKGSGIYSVEFIDDYMEHMDVLWKSEIMEILLADNENFGEVVFISAEGDNAGAIWGYRIANGELTLLEGEINVKDAVL